MEAGAGQQTYPGIQQDAERVSLVRWLRLGYKDYTRRPEEPAGRHRGQSMWTKMLEEDWSQMPMDIGRTLKRLSYAP